MPRRSSVAALLGAFTFALSACQPGSPGGSSPPSAASSSPATADIGCLGVAAGSTGPVPLMVSGQQRQALVHVPAGDVPASNAPVVLMFHGYRDTAGYAEESTGLSAKADAAGFIVVYLQAAGDFAKWDIKGTTDVAFVDAVLAALAADACVDTSRIYAAGFSMGGGMATSLACRHADRIAAVASVSGVYGPNWADPCHPARLVPIVAFHGAIDREVPYAGGPIDNGENPDLPPVIGVETWASAWAARNGCGSAPVARAKIGEVEPLFWDDCPAPVHLYRIDDGGHTWPDPAASAPMTNRDISATDVIWEFVSEFSLTAR